MRRLSQAKLGTTCMIIQGTSKPNLAANLSKTSHLNSVDKNADGDYLVSARNTNCIYKISGRDGSIIWRLGGRDSSFILNGFNFSSQHDARFRKENSTTTIISFLNNASDGTNSSADTSSALFVALETSTSPMTARVINHYDRPDKNLTHLRGNVQLLPNSNVFVGWSTNGYISESTPTGECVLEARFASMRFANYRAYKFNFTSSPSEPPTLKAFAFGAPPGTISTIFYVSWNGATEVASWNFYGSKDPAAGLILVGRVPKSGFETMFTFAGYIPNVFAEAVDADGRVLGTSGLEWTIAPPGSDFGHGHHSALDLLTLDANLGGSSLPSSSAGVQETFIGSPRVSLAELIRSWVESLQNSLMATVMVVVACILVIALFYIWFRKSRRLVQFRYSPLPRSSECTEISSSHSEQG